MSELFEREKYLEELLNHYREAAGGRGRTVFLMGEAGIGKTALINNFITQLDPAPIIYSGACDSLFTPRPLGPLFDIAEQIGDNFLGFLRNEKDRAQIFAAVINKLSLADRPVVLIFEDIHWADEATIDLIKFLARRISRHKCLFLLTYRNNEVFAKHPVTSIFGELPVEHFSKIAIDRLSKKTVDQLALKKGYASGEKLYTLTAGNPFYVTEVLASYSPGIPERIKDSILAVFHSRREETRELWEFLSILPSSNIHTTVAKQIENDFANMESCIAAGVIISRPGHLSFKHELFRLTIEESLSHYRRRSLHRKMLDILQKAPEGSYSLSQFVHHARYAEERALVAKFAPKAAEEAATLGAHVEASKLYATAIEYTDKGDPELVELYERHAYECYLTGEIAEAIESQQRALDIWREKKISLKEGDMLRQLSWLWWFKGDIGKALTQARESIEVLENGLPTRERALAYSNFSRLSMFCDDDDNALLWGNKALDLAVDMEDRETECNALASLGSTLLKIPASENQGEEILNRSLSIALEHGYYEHAARAYSVLSFVYVLTGCFEKAAAVFDVGLKYCEERDLNSWKYYMITCQCALLLKTGKWNEAEIIARRLQLHPNNHVNVTALVILAKLSMRRGDFETARTFIRDAKAIAMPSHEMKRTVQVLVAEMELCWITGDVIPTNEIIWAENKLFHKKSNSWHYSDLAYWMQKSGLTAFITRDVTFTTPFKFEYVGEWKTAANEWKKVGCLYEEALALFEGDDEAHQKEALVMLDALGATATKEMLKSKLRLNGVRNIPRGPRESTRSNPARLTNRQIDVLALLKDGFQNAEIADKLFISARTVEHHLSSIFSKLNVNTRSKAVNEARRLGILTA